MITDQILSVGGYLFMLTMTWVLSLLPQGQHLPTEITDGIQTVFGYMYLFDFILPIQTIFTLLGLSLLFQFSMGIWKFIYMIIRIVRG